MNIHSILSCKRDGGELSTEQINWFIHAIVAGEVADYQTSALLMAIYLRGMTRRETVDLTLAMARSGDMLDLHDVAQFVIDKHSSGGVGDKTTLVVQPLVAACGVPVGKMSGRGLGITGGTLDKMESIAGWSSQFTVPQFKQQLQEIGLVLAGQSAALAPADGILYALRDATATVGCIPLIAASIMSKKLAGGADGIVLDVKVGEGSYMKSVEQGSKLARTMVQLGQDAGRKTVALISDMNQPLGYAVGNALEVREALETLRGVDHSADFWPHCLEVASWMLVVAGAADSLDNAKQKIGAARESGAALALFRKMVEAQGGDVAQLDNPDLLPIGRITRSITAARDGIIQRVDALQCGLAAIALGAGRQQKHDTIDHGVGLRVHVKVGDHVKTGDNLVDIVGNRVGNVDKAGDMVRGAVDIGSDFVGARPLIHAVIQDEENYQ